MSDERVIVLKFGGSVLVDERGLRHAVHEIYRWRRDGYRVVAVVSALAGTTDALFERSRRVLDFPSDQAVAAVVSNGEEQSCGLLALELDRVGVTASVLSASSLRLAAVGPPLDATPVALDRARLEAALADDGVAIVPGFVAEDAAGRPVLLGRGGSDLTAFFLARCLGARCRLVKDVDGLYERDPASGGPPPRRYGRTTWADALATDGAIVQHKALRFAREHTLEFELGRLNGVRPTLVGSGPTVLDDGPESGPPLRVALLGLGTVGGGVWEHLRSHPELEPTVVCVRDVERAVRNGLPRELVTDDLQAAATCFGADVVVELVGGLDAARCAIGAALSAGADVVTANKRVLAVAGVELRSLASTCGRRLLASAAVGGSTPLLERLAGRPAPEVASVRGILNGTTNFLLDRFADGGAFDDALAEAQRCGFAEQDASRDLTGLDAGDKLLLIASELGLAALRPEDVARDEVAADAAPRAHLALARGRALRHVATLELGAGGARASVQLAELDPTDPLAAVRGEHNAAAIRYTDGTTELVRGKGAGRWPTAEAVLADVLALARSRR